MIFKFIILFALKKYTIIYITIYIDCKERFNRNFRQYYQETSFLVYYLVNLN